MHPLFKDMFHERWGRLSYCDEKDKALVGSGLERVDTELRLEHCQCVDVQKQKTMLGKAWSFCLPVDRRFR